MWKGPMTEELKQLFLQYAEQHRSAEPDEYEGIDYDDISYDEFVGYIRKCLETGLEIPYVIED